MGMKYQARQDPETALWVAANADHLGDETKRTPFRRGLLQRTNQSRTIYGPTGRPVAEVHVHDSGNTETEWDDNQDATVRPDPVRVTVTRDQYRRLLASVRGGTHG